MVKTYRKIFTLIFITTLFYTFVKKFLGMKQAGYLLSSIAIWRTYNEGQWCRDTCQDASEVIPPKKCLVSTIKHTLIYREYSGIPIFRILDFSKLSILPTKSRFPWNLLRSETVTSPPFFRTLDFLETPDISN